jgi:hypothetical protein
MADEDNILTPVRYLRVFRTRRVRRYTLTISSSLGSRPTASTRPVRLALTFPPQTLSAIPHEPTILLRSRWWLECRRGWYVARCCCRALSAWKVWVFNHTPPGEFVLCLVISTLANRLQPSNPQPFDFRHRSKDW